MAGSEVARLFVRIGADTAGLVTGITGAKRAISSLVTTTAGVGAILTAGLTVPLIAVGAQAVETASTYEQKMNLIKVITQSTSGEMEILSATLQKVGTSGTTFGANALDAADAATELLKAGLSTDQIFGDLDQTLQTGTLSAGALQATLDVAAATGLEFGRAAEIVVTTMANFGISSEDSVGVMDMFVRTANASILEVDDLAASFKNVGPTAAIFGLSIEDTSTALALLSQHGIRGAEAGTALKRMFINIQRPTKSVQEAMGELNLSLYDSQGNMKDVKTILGEFSDALFGASAQAKGMTDQQRNQYIQTIAGVYGMKALNSLLVGGVPAWDAMTSSIASQAGAAEVAAARLEGFKGSMAMLKKNVTAFLIKAGTPLLANFLTPLVGKISGGINALANMDTKWFELAAKIGLVVAAAGPVLLIFSLIVAVLGAILSPVGLVIAGVVALGAAFVEAQGGIDALANKIESIKTIFAGSGSTGAKTTSALQILGLPEDIATKIGGAIDSIISGAKKSWDRIKDIFAEDEKGDKKGGISGAITTLFANIPELGKAMQPLRDAILKGAKDILGGVWTDFAAENPDIANPLEQIFGGATKEGGPDWEKILGGLETLGTVLGEKLEPVIKTAWETALKTPLPFAPNLTLGGGLETLTTAFNKLKEAAQPVIDAIGGYLSPTLVTLNENAAPLSKAFQELGTALEKLWVAAQPIVQIVGVVLGAVLVTLAGILRGVLNAGIVAFRVAIEALTPAIDIASGIIDVFLGLVSLIAGVIEGDSKKVEKAWEKIKEAAERVFNGVIDFITITVSGWGEIIGTLLGTAIDSVAGLVTGNASKLGTDLVNGIKKGLDDAWGSVIKWLEDKAKGLPEPIRNILGVHSPSTVFAGIGTDIVGGLVQGMEGSGGSVADALMQISEYFMSFAQSVSAEQAKNMQNIASAFQKLGKGVDELVGSIAKLQQMQPPGAGSTNADMFGAWLDQFLVLAEMAMTRIEAVIEAFGYKRIHKLKLTAARLKSIVESVMIDLSGMTERKIPDLGVWFGQLHEVFNHAAGFVAGIRAKYSNKMLDDMAAAAANIKAMFVIIDVDLTKIQAVETPDWAAQLAAYLGQVTLLAGSIVAWLGGFQQSVRNMIANAAETAGNIAKLWQVFVDLKQIAPSTSATFMDDVALYIKQIEVSAGLIVAWLGGLSLEAQAMVTQAATIAEPMGKVFTILGVDLKAAVPPAPNFPVLFAGFLGALTMVAPLLIGFLDGLRVSLGGDVIKAAAETAQAVKTVFDILGIGKLFADLTDVSKINVGDLLTKLTGKLSEGLAVLVPAMQLVQTEWGAALEVVKGTVELVKSVIDGIVGIVGEINKLITEGIPTPAQMGAVFGQLNGFMGAMGQGLTMPVTMPVAPIAMAGGAPDAQAGVAPSGAASQPSEITLHLDINVNGEPFQNLTKRLDLGRAMDITLGEIMVTA